MSSCQTMPNLQAYKRSRVVTRNDMLYLFFSLSALNAEMIDYVYQATLTNLIFYFFFFAVTQFQKVRKNIVTITSIDSTKR